MKYFLLCGLLPLLLLTACAKKGLDVQPVSGIVTVDGQPVKGVLITFEPTDADSIEKAFAQTDAQGVYKLSSTNGPPQAGALAGEYRVTASWQETEKFVTIRGVEFPTYEEKLPKMYQDPETSGLAATVKRGKNKIDFGLKSKP